MTGTKSSDGKLLDDDITPIKRHFVRSDGVPTNVNVDDWSLSIDGEVETPLTSSIAVMKSRLEVACSPCRSSAGATAARPSIRRPRGNSGRSARSATRSGSACASGARWRPLG